MVVTSWRSGSTLIGELLNSYPKSYYSYEPLDLLRIRRAYAGDKDATVADKVIKSLLTCNYAPLLQECKQQLNSRVVTSVLSLILLSSRCSSRKIICQSCRWRIDYEKCLFERFLQDQGQAARSLLNARVSQQNVQGKQISCYENSSVRIEHSSKKV